MGLNDYTVVIWSHFGAVAASIGKGFLGHSLSYILNDFTVIIWCAGDAGIANLASASLCGTVGQWAFDQGRRESYIGMKAHA